MAKIAELFVSSNGPHTCRVARISKQSINGQEKDLYSFTHGNVDFDYFPSASAMKRLAGIAAADYVEVTKVPPSGTIQFAYYTFKKIPAPVGAPIASLTPSLIVSGQPDDFQHREETKQNRISIAGYLQALIHSGKDIEAAKLLAIELVTWGKMVAEKMYQEDHEAESL